MNRSPGHASLWDGLSGLLDLASDCGTLLISAEDYARPTQLAKLADRLRAEAPDVPVRFIVYLRRYDQLLESAYAQSVRGQFSGPITDCGYNMEFRAILRRILDHPGQCTLVVRPYNRQHWPQGALARDFLQALGLDALWGRMQVDPGAVVNPSLPRAQTHILSCLTSPPAKHALLKYFTLNPPPIPDGPSRYFYAPSERLAINRQFLDGDRALLNALGITDPEGFLDSESFPDAADWTPFQPDPAAIMAYLAAFIDWRLAPKPPPPPAERSPSPG